MNKSSISMVIINSIIYTSHAGEFEDDDEGESKEASFQFKSPRAAYVSSILSSRKQK